MAAQTPSADNRTNIEKASLVKAKAISYLGLSDRNSWRRRGSPQLLTEQACGDTKLRSTSSSFDCEKSVLRADGQ
jgi:hypothetical protein